MWWGLSDAHPSLNSVPTCLPRLPGPWVAHWVMFSHVPSCQSEVSCPEPHSIRDLGGEWPVKGWEPGRRVQWLRSWGVKSDAQVGVGLSPTQTPAQLKWIWKSCLVSLRYCFLQVKQSESRGDHKRISVCICVHAKFFSRGQLSVTPRTVPHQAPLSMGFSRQEYWDGFPCPPPGDLPNPGI